ncbi:MAG: ABC transporter ATP-binding protein [Actinobacteria bacterium]|uniref:ABC transporter ATP-binding protein n=1 Tax=Nostocoides veronense TaxID=330836 RepID=A0ABN2LWZ5_9MICO|nr:ABC transporter ATP-binding protein [Actinomycetota bacterium]
MTPNDIPRSGTTPSRLYARDLRLGYGSHSVVHDLDVVIPDGRITGIVGANACGKSTLLRGLARLLKPTAGTVILDGTDIHRRPTGEVARTLGLLPQQPVVPSGVTVTDLVGRGRYPHQSGFRRWSSEDDAIVAEALDLTGTIDLADRLVDELSGGQRQRVWIAMALAQHTDLLLLDEPTTYLDLAHQIDVLDLLAELNNSRGTTIVMVLHELNLAARYADHLIAMQHGRIRAEGTPDEVITEDIIRDVFGLASRVVLDPVSATPMVLPLSTRRKEAHERLDSRR